MISCILVDRNSLWNPDLILHLDLDHWGFRKSLPACVRHPLHWQVSLLAWEGLRSWDMAPALDPYLCLAFSLEMILCWLPYLHDHSFFFTLSSLILSLFPFLAHTCTRPRARAHTTHTHTHRGKSICVRHSARERQRHWVNYPSFTAAEKSRWQQTICKWQGAVNYSIFLD